MKRNFVIQLDDDTRTDFAHVAAGGHMEDTKYAAVWVNELSTLKPEFALKVLGLIPPEWKKRGPGRPASTTTRTNAPTAHAETARQDVA